MTRYPTMLRLALVATIWWLAKSPLVPPPIAATLAMLAVLGLPGILIERLMFGSVRPYGWLSAPARWLTWSVAAVAVVGVAATQFGMHIGEVLLALAALSGVLAAMRATSSPRPGGTHERVDSAETIARVALLALAVLLVILAASAPNVARDRMWYLAFITRLADGSVIDWKEPFLGSDNLAARFAFNDWLLALAAWAGLAGMPSALVFERLAPPALCVAVCSAAWHFTSRAVPRIAGLAALATITSLVATSYPFFSPDRYPFFARIAEDKTVALLVFLPVTMTSLLELTRSQRSVRELPAWSAFGLGIVAVGFGHGLVALLVCVGVTALAVFAAGKGNEIAWRRAVAAMVVTAILVSIPGRMSLLARAQIVDADDPAGAWSDDTTHPVVRAHLRMERTRDLDRGGPIVEPSLLAEPLLAAGTLGVARAVWLRASAGGAMLAAMSTPFLALAFVPYVAPLFAQVVLPWMAYRALWMIPFGTLAVLLVAAPRPRRTMTTLRAATAVLLLFHALAALPQRHATSPIVAPGFAGNFSRDADVDRMLTWIATLPPTARIAAAPGFAELIPALVGRSVAAFSDRGTVVFAGSREHAEQRLRASALIVGLGPGSAPLRRAAATEYGVTHVVLSGRRCGRLGREIARSGDLMLCEVRRNSPARYRALPITRASSRGTVGGSIVATLESGWKCDPAPIGDRRQADVSIWRWHRTSRWTAAPVVVRCRAALEIAANRLVLRIAADLPRAEEAIVYRVRTRSASGSRSVKTGVVELEGTAAAEIPFDAEDVRSVRLQLAPAYLPYLNLRELALRNQGGVGE